MSQPLIFLSAGEASGDTYGAALMACLREHLPSATFTGLGGRAMDAAGQKRVVRAEDVAVMGITEILRHIPHIYASYRRLVRSVRRHRPDIAILIDFPDVNFRLAKHLRRAGVPVIWFVSPQLWAWKRRRLRWVQERVDKMLVIFPFEERFYRERGVDAEFVGHPLAAGVPGLARVRSRETYAAEYGLDPNRTWIALLPGSRWKEVRAHLPVLHELAMGDLIASAAAHTTFREGQIETPANPAVHARYEFILPVASTIDPTKLSALIAELNREHLRYFGPEAAALRLTMVSEAGEALFHARAAVVASGTATVLAAIVGNPFVVVYRVSPLTFAVAQRLVRYPEEFPALADASGHLPIAMVNLIAGRRIVPELLQKNFTAANVASALAPLLPEGPERTAQMNALSEMRGLLLSSPEAASPMQRVATIVVQMLGREAQSGSGAGSVVAQPASK